MNIKKIIIILLVFVIILGTLFFVLLSNRPNLQNETGESTDPVTQQNKDTQSPTGIIRPTSQLQEGELDITAVSPADGSLDVETGMPLEITFSRKFTMTEIEFIISPNTPYLINNYENKLIVAPQTSWETGTPYGFSINFTDDDQQVRLYRFTTTGPTPSYLPDTQAEEVMEYTNAYEKENNPDIYVANQTPYETDTFAIRADFEPKVPAHYYFTVTTKTGAASQAQAAVNEWLKSLDLTQEQIDNLDIRYE